MDIEFRQHLRAAVAKQNRHDARVPAPKLIAIGQSFCVRMPACFGPPIVDPRKTAFCLNRRQSPLASIIPDCGRNAESITRFFGAKQAIVVLRPVADLGKSLSHAIVQRIVRARRFSVVRCSHFVSVPAIGREESQQIPDPPPIHAAAVGLT